MPKQKYKVVKSIEHLKKLALAKDNENPKEFAIMLGRGLIFSRKTIVWDNETFLILNHIDDSGQELTEKELKDPKNSNIYEAIKKRALLY